jgi:outer membrane protein assembly factor BamB
MNINQLIFIGLNGYVVALDRTTGEIVWSNNELKDGYVSLLLDGDQLIVSTNGYIFCLSALTGQIRWQNPLRGYGEGVATMVSVHGSSEQILNQHAASDEQRRVAQQISAQQQMNAFNQ